MPYQLFVRVLQVSSAHLYLTYPFVLSWSLIESMALECRIVASDTAPVREVITDGENGRLFPFFDPTALVARVRETLETDGSAALAGRRGGRRWRNMISSSLPAAMAGFLGVA